MRVSGTLYVDRRNDERYFVFINFQRHKTTYFLLSPYHSEDRFSLSSGGVSNNFPIYSLDDFVNFEPSEDYIMEIIERVNISGEMKSLNRSPILSMLLIVLSKCRTYSFSNDQIIRNSEIFSDGSLVKAFSASDPIVSINYRLDDDIFTFLRYDGPEMYVEFDNSRKCKFPSIKDYELNIFDVRNNSRLKYSHIKSLDYDSLKKYYDDHLSWYEEPKTGVILKKYVSVHNIEEFERIVIMGIVSELKLAREENRILYSGLKQRMDLIIDTETTGLNVYDMPLGMRSEVVAIPMSWKVNTGVVIFCDMQYFDNIDLSYVVDRLAPFFGKNFGPSSECEICIDTIEGPFIFKRNEINTSNHNVPFDIRAIMTVKCTKHLFKSDIAENNGFVQAIGQPHKFWFDDDSMVLSFNVNPSVVKKSNALKDVTRRLFGHETPELGDLLGKGNEARYAWISDERVATIYGCADADYALQVLNVLRRIYKSISKFVGKDLYKTYRVQDMVIMNITAKMDFEGLRTDGEKLTELAKKCEKDLGIITKECYRYAGIVIGVKNWMQRRDSEIRSGIKETETEINIDNLPPYEFQLSGDSLTNTMYKVLEYPPSYTNPKNIKKNKDSGVEKVASSESKPRLSANKYVIEKLFEKKNPKPITYLKSDVLGSDGTPLIIADIMNSCKYPLAYNLSLYGPRLKEFNSFFKPFLTNGIENRLYSRTSFTSIDTRRMSNPFQTVKKSLKDLILPKSDDYICFDWDMSQVEIRVMHSLAGDKDMIEKLRNSEKDPHIEAAADMYKVEPFNVTKEQRSNAKNNNFAFPYGIGSFSLCKRLHNNHVDDESLFQTRILMELFRNARRIVVDFIEKVRDGTLNPCDNIPEDVINYLGIPKGTKIGKVQGAMGFYKLFELENLTDMLVARIRRQSGNFIIQEFAAELYRIMLWRFYMQCEARGYNDDGRVQWHMVVHDELLGSYHKSIHPIEIVKMVKEACFITIKDHTTYYVGLNIGGSWGTCKNDDVELPVICMERLAKRWDSGEFVNETVYDHELYMREKRAEYLRDRIGEVIESIGDAVSDGIFDICIITERFTNYMVRKYLIDEYKPLWPVEKDNDGAKLESCLARWILDKYGDGKILLRTDGSKISITHDLENGISGVSEEFIDLDLGYYNDMSWSLTYNDAEAILESFDSDDEIYDENEYTSIKIKEYKYIRILNGILSVQLDRNYKYTYLVEWLNNSHLLNKSEKDSYACYARFFKDRKRIGWIKKQDNYDELDVYVSSICGVN